MTLTKTTVANTENLCLCKLATDPKFVTEVGVQIDTAVWTNDWCRILCGFILDYTRHYSDIALPMLKKIAKDKAQTIRDEATAEAVVQFAGHLQEYYEEHKELFSNEKYIRDTILKWIKERNLAVLSEKINNALDVGNIEKAEDALHKYSEVKQTEFTAVNMMSDVAKIVGAYEEERGELMKLPGELGQMTGPLSRGDMLLILGESGTGKSFVSLQIAYDAVLAGLSVLYFNLENTESQMIRRIYSNMSGCAREEKTVSVPYFAPAMTEYTNDDGESVVTKWKIAFKDKHLDAPNLNKEAVSKFLDNRVMESNGGQFLLESYAPKELTIKGIEHELDNLLEYKNFCPDVLIVDYGDLVRPENTKIDRRLQVDSIYMGLREIALKRNIIVISPVQANRQGYGKNVKKSNIAENIGSVSHASIILGLNHTEEEKEKGIMRINLLKCRDGIEHAEPVLCLGCMDIGRPIIQSKWMHNVNYTINGDTEEEDE